MENVEDQTTPIIHETEIEKAYTHFGDSVDSNIYGVGPNLQLKNLALRGGYSSSRPKSNEEFIFGPNPNLCRRKHRHTHRSP